MTANAARRKRLVLSWYTVFNLHLRHPLMTVWWAAAFTGFSSILMGNYLRGYLLMALEIIINVQAHLNLAILYSFTGRFELAKSAVDTRWLLAYVLVYVYGLWDAYTYTVESNKQSVLASLEKAPIDIFVMEGLSLNFIHKRTPWISLFWSGVMPGLGHFYLCRSITGYFLIIFFLVSAYFSHLFEVIQFTLLGDFSQAINVADPQWLLFLPSVYGFAAYDAYSSTVEINKLFDVELSELMQARYQKFRLNLPLEQEELPKMLITATFDQSTYVEMALMELEQSGIAKDKILAIPLEQPARNVAILDSIHRADGVSIVDTASVTATIGMSLGVIYGFVLPWGPIICGLIGLAIGIAVGLTGDYLQTRRNLTLQRRERVSELVLIVSCEKSQVAMVEQILRDKTALGLGKVIS